MEQNTGTFRHGENTYKVADLPGTYSLAANSEEEIGYMVRISYVFDGTMRHLGLHGKAVMPFLVSFGCNIASATGVRVLDTWDQRMAAAFKRAIRIVIVVFVIMWALSYTADGKLSRSVLYRIGRMIEPSVESPDSVSAGESLAAVAYHVGCLLF
ncbi:nucleoside recognition domain-containing protein [Marvinbryantia formatexigens]|nr:nucleoside recognition domain-containing protein [Marvinbryantia formatexigens]UWO26119.1 hypothetical protein NQ534_06535 [Marvinbryantia formatexigens DSM 14469]